VPGPGLVYFIWNRECIFSGQQVEYTVLSSVAEPEPHHLVGAVTRYGSDGSGSDHGIINGLGIEK
jgi:hypothetical protein